MNAERDCEVHDGEQRTDTEPAHRGAQLITEQAAIEAHRERQNRSDSAEAPHASGRFDDATGSVGVVIQSSDTASVALPQPPTRDSGTMSAADSPARADAIEAATRSLARRTSSGT